MAARAPKTSDSNNSFAWTETKTTRAGVGGDCTSGSKPGRKPVAGRIACSTISSQSAKIFKSSANLQKLAYRNLPTACSRARLSKAFPSHDRQGVECANFCNLALAVHYCTSDARISGISKTARFWIDRKSTRLNSSHLVISYAV